MDWDEAKEQKVPLAAGGAGFLLMMVREWFVGSGVTVAFSSSAIRLVLALGLGFVACRIVARTMEVNFGEQQEAAIKLGGILAASAGICALLPWWAGWLPGILVCGALLKWLYELDRTPLIASTLGMSAGIWAGLWIGGRIAGWLNAS